MAKTPPKPQPAPPAATAETAARAKARRYQQLFESSPLPMWVYDLQTLRFLDVNEVACQKYGYTRDEFLAMTILDIRPPGDAAAVEESVRTQPASVFNAGIWRHRLKSGELIHVEITSHEMQFMGRRTRFVCPIDVTQRVRAEAALREREAALRRAQVVAQLGHVVTGADGAFERWSETLPTLAGLAPQDMPRTTREWMNRLVHAADRALFRQTSLEAARTQHKAEVEYRLVRPTGEIVHIAQVIEPLDDPSAAPGLRWFSTLQDVTVRKEAERAMRRMNEELERRVKARTAQLAAASEAAERANQAKSEFLTRMSHEMRTPLNAILGFSELLARPDHQVGPQQQARFNANIHQAGEHLLALVSDLLNLAQIEAGKVGLQMQLQPLAEVLAECETMIAPQAAALHLTTRFTQLSPTLQIVADRTRLRQVLLNLLSNAVKYNRPGGAVQVEVSQPSLERVRIEVRDTGIGLDADQVRQLFQPFNRLGRERDSEGTGLGLVVTKHLIELMGGRISVDSAPGVGSRFSIELAATRLPVSAPAPRGAARSPGGAHESAPRTVLCVEDDLVTLELVKAMLAPREDLRLISAINGREGVALALAYEPAVILMDNQMPEMSGQQAMQLLAQDPRTSGIPIIAMSASPSAPALEGAANNGERWFRRVAKPFDREQLLSAIDEAVRRS